MVGYVRVGSRHFWEHVQHACAVCDGVRVRGTCGNPTCVITTLVHVVAYCAVFYSSAGFAEVARTRAAPLDSVPRSCTRGGGVGQVHTSAANLFMHHGVAPLVMGVLLLAHGSLNCREPERTPIHRGVTRVRASAANPGALQHTTRCGDTLLCVFGAAPGTRKCCERSHVFTTQGPPTGSRKCREPSTLARLTPYLRCC